MSEFPTSSEDSTGTSDPPTPPPKRQKASTSTGPGKHKGARTHIHKVKEGEGKGKGKKRREPSPSSASSGSDSNSPDHCHKSTKERFKKLPKNAKSSRNPKPSSQDERSHLDIFQHHYSDLVLSITPCLNTVANLLFSRKFISGELQRQVLDGRETDQKIASKVLFCVQDKITLSPEYLIKFIDILKKESSCDVISKRIRSK